MGDEPPSGGGGVVGVRLARGEGAAARGGWDSEEEEEEEEDRRGDRDALAFHSSYGLASPEWACNYWKVITATDPLRLQRRFANYHIVAVHFRRCHLSWI